MVGSTNRAVSILVVLVALGLVTLTSSPSGAGQPAPNLSNIFISKIEEPGTFSFEGCVVGSFILAGGTLDYPGNGQGPLPLTLAEGEWCYEQAAASQMELDMLFPSSGQVYTFAVPGASGTSNYDVTFNVSRPTASPLISNPVAASNVLSDRDLPAEWALSGPCAICDGILFEFDSSMTSTSSSLPIGATSAVVSSADIVNGPSNEVFVSVYDGVIDSTPPSQNGDTFMLGAVYEVAALAQFAGVARTLDISQIFLFKGVDRINGVVLSVDPYFFEACVIATGLSSATVDTPDGLKVLTPEEDGESCFEDAFADRATLDSTYLSAGETYTFELTQADGATADVPAVFDEINPGASTVVTNPVDMGVVPPAMDLTVMWSLDLGMPACNIALDCGDGIAVFVEDDSTFMEVFAAESLPITDTDVVVPAAALAGGPNFFLETETFNGVETTGILDGETDTYDSLIRYEDLNGTSFVVPEPSLALVQVAALTTLAGLARRRRKRA